MGKGKPRTKEQPWYYKNKCQYFDGLYTRDGSNTPIHECFYPWRHKCTDGNIHNCTKLKLRWLASLDDKKRKTELTRIENGYYG